tara:strand:+ start:483 stop:689 length:207 start_codon:yes stop_codon:yes gene_type:complete
MKKINMTIDQQNAKSLIDLALIYARNNSDKFLKTNLLKQTTFTETDLERLTDNYINHSILSIQRYEDE